MNNSIFQQFKISSYIMNQKLNNVKRYPLVLMLEPKFRSNLKSPLCGKTDYPDAALDEYLSPERCFYALKECGAPVVAIAGGEPLLHDDMPEIVEGLIKRKKFVYLCTNGLLINRCIYDYVPSKYFYWSVELDGFQEDHDKIVDKQGAFEEAVSGIKYAKSRDFNVTVNCTIYLHQRTKSIIEFFDFLTNDLKVDGINISPSYPYERASDQKHFLSRENTKRIFRAIFLSKKFKKWKLNHTSLYLDFLAGNQSYYCKPWSNPTFNIFGWQKPCFHLNEGYYKTFEELMEKTLWDQYGTGSYEKCADCMTHCGYEGAAIEDMYERPFKALSKKLFGIKTRGPMLPEINLKDARPAEDVYDKLVESKMYELDLM